MGELNIDYDETFDCKACALKHIACAYSLWLEYLVNDKFKIELVQCIGELRCSEMHLQKDFPDLSSAIRELRLSIMDGMKPWEEFNKLMIMVGHISGLFEKEI